MHSVLATPVVDVLTMTLLVRVVALLLLPTLSACQAPLLLDENYSDTTPPPRDAGPIRLRTEFIVSHIDVDDTENSMTLRVSLNMIWNDTRLSLDPSVHRHNSTDSEGFSDLDYSLMNWVWHPDIFIYNLTKYEVLSTNAPMSGFKLRGYEVNIYHSIIVKVRWVKALRLRDHAGPHLC